MTEISLVRLNLLRVAWPLWSAHQMDAATTQTLNDVLPIVLFPLLIPWSYVVKQYVRQSADPWRRQRAPTPAAR